MDCLVYDEMADVFSQKKRSRVMAAIRSKGNKTTELRLISILRAYGISGWRRNLKFPGKPDFVFRRERLLIFVDGCFWHGCKKHCRLPQTNRRYWQNKIARNAARDKKIVRCLQKNGWRVLRLWEHSLKTPAFVKQCIKSRLSVAG
jgi:DNA mismatch endonuclease (patch repair protein)